MPYIDKINYKGTEYDIQDTNLKEDIEQHGGLSGDAKQALLACFRQVAWIENDGKDYYDALEISLYPPPDLASISAVYTQSGAVYESTSLDSLKADLVVTATYSDSSTEVVTAYTLSGTLVVGSSTITVAYAGKTASFTVAVSETFSVTNSLLNCTNSNDAEFVGEGESYTATISPATYYDLSSVTITMGGVDITSSVYDGGDITIPEVTGGIIITASAYIYSYDTNDGTMKIYTGSTAWESANPGRITNNPYGNGNNRRSFFTEIVGVLNILKKTGATTYEETDFYPIPVPPDATGISISVTTPDTSPYTGTGEYSFENNLYSQVSETGWVQGATYSFTLNPATQYITVNNKRNSSGSNYTTSTEITRATVVFTK